MLQVQLNGNPAKELPFSYDSKRGGFARIEDGRKGLKFDELPLIIDFSFPLNKMLQYKEIFEMIQ